MNLFFRDIKYFKFPEKPFAIQRKTSETVYRELPYSLSDFQDCRTVVADPAYIPRAGVGS